MYIDSTSFPYLLTMNQDLFAKERNIGVLSRGSPYEAKIKFSRENKSLSFVSSKGKGDVFFDEKLKPNKYVYSEDSESLEAKIKEQKCVNL